MGHCYLCQDGKHSYAHVKRRVNGKKKDFCTGCKYIWDNQIKEKIIAYLYKNEMPSPLFLVPNVRRYDMDNQTYFIGDLLITDKGIVFMIKTESKMIGPLSEFASAVLSGGLWGGNFGLLPHAIKQKSEKAEGKKLAVKVANIDEAKKSYDLKQLLKSALQLQFFPKNEIKTISRSEGGLFIEPIKPLSKWRTTPDHMGFQFLGEDFRVTTLQKERFSEMDSLISKYLE
jgi:hypothetical protein